MFIPYGNVIFDDVTGNVWEDEPEPTYICASCEREIYRGHKVYKIEGQAFCPKCAQRSCGDILRSLGGEDKEAKPLVCNSCEEIIQGKYIAFNGCNYCKDCFTDYGEGLIEEIFGEAEIAPKPEEWGNPWDDRWED